MARAFETVAGYWIRWIQREAEMKEGQDGDGDGKKFGILRFYLFSVVRDSISIYLAPLEVV